MVKNKRFRTDVFITALIVTLFIFYIGFLLGSKLDTFRVDDANRIVQESELDAESFLLEQNFFDLFDGNKCKLAPTRLEKLSEQFAEIGSTLTRYEAKDLTKGYEYEILKHRYFLLEIKYYMFLKESKEECNLDNNVILFFYDVDNDIESLRQGYVLDTIVKENPGLIVISLDREFKKDLLLNSVISYYEIKSSPALIFNFENKSEGFVSEGELRAMLKNGIV